MAIVMSSDMQVYEMIIDYEERRKHNPDTKLILCKGDSWFSIGGTTSSIPLELNELDTTQDLLIVVCAYPGETLYNMKEVASKGRGAFISLLDPKYGVLWDAILISGGGNDIIDWLASDSYAFSDVHTMDYYISLIDEIRLHQTCPILLHGYSIPEIRYKNKWYEFFKLGPWIGPRMLKKYPNVSKLEHQKTLRFFFRQFHSQLRQLEAKYNKIAAVLPYRDYDPVTKWVNEIHPAAGSGGYKEVARALYMNILHFD